jgi:hypothetical protein
MYRRLEKELCYHSQEEIKRDGFWQKWQEDHPAPDKPKVEDFQDRVPWRYDDYQAAQTKYHRDMHEWTNAFNAVCIEKYGRVCYVYECDPYPYFFCEECLLLMLNFLANNKDKPLPYSEERD